MLAAGMPPKKIHNHLRLEFRPPNDPKALGHGLKLKQFHSVPSVRAIRNRCKALRSGREPSH